MRKLYLAAVLLLSALLAVHPVFAMPEVLEQILVATPSQMSSAEGEESIQEDLEQQNEEIVCEQESAAEEDETLSLQVQIEAELVSILQELTDCADMELGKQKAGWSYRKISNLFDRVDNALEQGEIQETEYDEIMERMNGLCAEIFEQYEKFGYDPYGIMPAYGRVDTNGWQWSYSWDGNTLRIFFNIHYWDGSGSVQYFRLLPTKKDTTATNLQTTWYHDDCLLWFGAYCGTSTSSEIFRNQLLKNSRSGYGSLTITSATTGSASVYVQGYIDVTGSNIQRLYNDLDQGWIWYCGYYGDGNNSMSFDRPGGSELIREMCRATMHTHSYSWAAVDGTTHKYYCTGCGEVSSTSAHNSDTADTSTKVGYTVRRCSVCNYAVSTSANSYLLHLDNTGAFTEGTTEIEAVYDAAMPDITIPYKTGYTFDGYYTEENGAGTKYYDANGSGVHIYDIAGEKKLYPNWVKAFDIQMSGTVQNDFAFPGI